MTALLHLHLNTDGRLFNINLNADHVTFCIQLTGCVLIGLTSIESARAINEERFSIRRIRPVASTVRHVTHRFVSVSLLFPSGPIHSFIHRPVSIHPFRPDGNTGTSVIQTIIRSVR